MFHATYLGAAHPARSFLLAFSLPEACEQRQALVLVALRLYMQEVSIMRKVRHKNVVQFIGACTRKPNLCIVFEYMSGGSAYDYIRRVSSG